MRTILAALAIFSAGALTPAAAQTTTLSCQFDDLYQASMVDGAVQYETSPDSGDVMSASFDFGAGAFDFAGTTGQFAATPERVVGLAEDEDLSRGIVEIDRRSGRVRVTAMVTYEGQTRYAVATGQCQTADGGTSF